MDNPNQTREDAHKRLLVASMGCLVNASETYLVAFRSYLYELIGKVEDKLEEIRREEREEDDYCFCSECLK